MNILTEIIGYIAVLCSFSAFIPQVMRTYKTKSAADLSLGTFIIYNFGIISWLIYGLLINSFPLILSGLLTLISTLTILYMKIKYDLTDSNTSSI